MPEDPDDRGLEELKVLLERNKQAIEALRCMVENMEVLLSSFFAPKPEGARRRSMKKDREPASER